MKGTTVRTDDTTAATAGVGLNRAGRRAEARRLRRAGAALAVVPAALGTAALLVGGTAVPAGAATLTVTSLNDADSDGFCDVDCTLRDALSDANDGDTIVFATGLTGDYDITTELDIDDAVTIQGPGAGVIAIDGTGTTEIFQLGADTTDTITISGLTLKNGSANSGGAIYNGSAGNLVVDSVVFDNNDATAFGGGAIYQNDGVLTVTNSTFTGNTADSYGGAIYAGYLDGPLTITGSTFTDNESTEEGGGAVAAFYDEDNDVFDLIVTDSTFTGNTAEDMGGALYAQELNDVTITGSTFTDNTSATGGGGIRIQGDDVDSNVVISDTTISGNTADDYGGGLYLDDVVDLTISGTTITDNAADGGGGGIYANYVYGDISITDSNISGNTASGYGGGLYLGSDIGKNDGSVTITRTTIAGNTADDGGGGVNLYRMHVPLVVRNSTISGNTAADDGGGIYFSADQSDAAAALIVENSTISGNTATGDGGGIFFGSTAYDLELVMTTISMNTAGGDGDGVFLVPFVPGPSSAKAPKAPKAPKAGSAGPAGTATPRPTRERGPRATAAATQSATGTIIWGNGTQDLGGTATLTSTKNVIGTKAAGITVTGDALTTDPLLGPLADNGGPTQTHALLVGSPAIDAGPSTVPTFPGNEYDQRGPGYARTVNATTDIGAYEVQTPDPEVITFTG